MILLTPPSTSAQKRKLLPATRLMAALLIAVLSAGCAATDSLDDDRHYGDASRALRAQQFIAADAPLRNADTLPPTDGRTLREAVSRQVESFKRPPPTHIINIGVGGVGGGGSGGGGG